MKTEQDFQKDFNELNNLVTDFLAQKQAAIAKAEELSKEAPALQNTMYSVLSLADNAIKTHQLFADLDSVSYDIKRKCKAIALDYYGLKKEYYDFGHWVKEEVQADETV